MVANLTQSSTRSKSIKLKFKNVPAHLGSLSLMPVTCASISVFAKNRLSVGQNRQISKMSSKFCQFTGQYVQLKIMIQKNAKAVLWATWSSMDENCTYFQCILTIFHQIAVFTEFEKTTIQIKQIPIIFVRHFSFLLDKFF